MPNNPLDPRRLWQIQPLTPDEIPYKERELRAKTSRDLLRSALVPVFATLLSVGGLVMADNLASRAAFVALIAWNLTGQYILARRARFRPPCAPRPGIDSYREAIAEQREVLRLSFRWLAAPIFLTIVIFIAPYLGRAVSGGFLANLAPFLSMFVLWTCAVLTLQVRGYRRLTVELDELNRLEAGRDKPSA